jgi:hypothetical protein
VCLLGRLFYVTTRVNRLDVVKGKKSSTDLLIEKSVERYGFTPNEKSDENLKWMRENGYLSKHAQKDKQGIRRKGSKSERF